MNMKGGVGKTTLSVHLAGYLSRYGFSGKKLRVLAIDYDPQFNLSQAFLDAPVYFALEKAKKTTLSILIDDAAALNPFQINVSGNHTPPAPQTITKNLYKSTDGGLLDLVPSTLDLMYVALGQATQNTQPLEERFEKFIVECRKIYDLIIIDCHPAGSLFTKTSLSNSDAVLIPVVPKKYAVRGIGLMMEFIKSKKLGSNGPDPLIVFNHTPRVGTLPEEASIRSDARYGAHCIPTSLKKFKAFEDPEGGKGFVWFSSKPYSSEAFTNLGAVAREVATRVKL